MNDRLRNLCIVLGVLLIIVLLPLVTMRRGRDQSDAISQRLSESKVKIDSLRSAMRYLERMTPLNRSQTTKEVRLALNTWLKTADVTEAAYRPPKSLSSLPREMLTEVGCQSETTLSFSELDVDYLFQARLLNHLSDWIVKFPVRDSLILPILEKESDVLDESDLAKLMEAYKLFDWTMRNVALEFDSSSVERKTKNPAGAISVLGDGYGYLPWETLLFSIGDVIEKGRVFTALASQRDIPTGWIVDAGNIWSIGVLLGGRIYLFEPKLAMPVLEPDELRLATLKDAKSNPRILRRLDLPGRFDYAFNPGDLNFLEIFVDLPPAAASARMKLLEQKLLGDERMRVFHDVDRLVKAFQECEPKATVKVWDLPLKAQVHALLVRDKLKSLTEFTRQYNTEHILWMQDNPASKARLKHLFGQFENTLQSKGALSLYMDCRFDAETLRKLDSDPDLQRAFQLEKDPNATREQHQNKMEIAVSVLRRAKVDAAFLLAQLHFDRGDYKEASSWLQERIINNDKPIERELANRWAYIAGYGLARAFQELGKEAELEEQLSFSPSPHEAGNRLRLRYWGKVLGDTPDTDS